MAMSTGPLPFDVNEIGSGACRVIATPVATALSKTFAGWFAQIGDYAPTAAYFDLGAKSGPAQYDRGITVAGLKIEEQDSVVLERVTDVVRTMVLPLSNITPQNVQIFENAPEVIAVAAAAGAMAFDKIPFGSFTDIATYRLLFVAQKVKSQGIVIEPTTLVQRGRWEGVMAYRAALTAATGSMAFNAGGLITMPVTMKLFPEPGEPAGEEYGAHMLEHAGTMT